MDTTYNQLYVETVRLARSLGIDPREVPQPFQLNELEQYSAELKAKAAAKQKAKPAKKETSAQGG